MHDSDDQHGCDQCIMLYHTAGCLNNATNYEISTMSLVSWQMSRLVFITDCQLHPSVYRRRPSFSSHCCSCLEQSAGTRHLHTLGGCLHRVWKCISFASCTPDLCSAHSVTLRLLWTF